MADTTIERLERLAMAGDQAAQAELSRQRKRQNLPITGVWHTQIHTYARVISHGHWLYYKWLQSVLPEIQRLLEKGNARIIVNAPPRHGKSEGITRHTTGWFLANFPDRDVILSSYNASKSLDWGADVRDDLAQLGLVDGGQTAAAGDWDTIAGGKCRSVGVGGSILGRGADLFVVDDPHKNYDEAHSQTRLESLKTWWKSTAFTRLEPGGSVLVVMQRWHDNDFSQMLLEDNEEDWHVFSMPALSEAGVPDFLNRPPGVPLVPERYTVEALQKIRQKIGPTLWKALYQQQPVSTGGNIWRREWFGRWTDDIREAQRKGWKYLDLSDPNLRWLQSWDCTFKESGSSYVCGQVWVKKGPDVFLIDEERDRWDVVATMRAMQRLSNRWPKSARKILIEDAANGPAIIRLLKSKQSGIVAVTAQGSKVARALACQGEIESGNVFVPNERVFFWVGDWLEEAGAFPLGSDNDRVDCASQAMNDLRESRPLSILSL